jgi:hypothetical protein
MKIATTLKTLTLLGLTSLTLASAASHADNGYGGYDRAPAWNPWGGASQNANPWMNVPAMHQPRFAAEMKQRLAQLDQRQDNQMQRILHGMEKGKITLNEAVGLLREHVAIANLERSYMADGRLGPRELVSLEQRLDEAAKQIKFEQKDREKVSYNERRGDDRHDNDRYDDKGRFGEPGRR